MTEIVSGKRVTLRIGREAPVEAEVSLIKMTRKLPEAQYETRVEGEPAAVEPGAWGEILGGAPRADAFGDTVTISTAAEPKAEEVSGEPPAQLQRGVLGPDGEWVDLTAALDEIDRATKLDGMEVEHTIAQSTIPSWRVRDSYYIGTAGAGAAKVLALIWDGLHLHGRAELVRWTKVKQQALGAVVARGGGSRGPRHLVLLELAWAENIRELPDRCNLDAAHEGLTARECGAAAMAVLAYHAPPSTLDKLRDERMGRRRDLLEAARAGRKWEAPPAQPEPVAAAKLREVLTASAA